jgi:AraC family transcriptional regulator
MQRPTLRPGSFFGKSLRTYRAGQLFLAESRYGPGFASPKHSHERAFCYLVLEGSCTQTCGSRTRTSSTSTLAFHPAGEAHSDHWHVAGGRCFHVEFDRPWLERVREHSPVLDQPAHFHGGTAVWLAARLYRELREPDTISALAVEGLALELVARAARDAGRGRIARPPAWVGRVRELLATRFREALTLADVAREAGVHPVHLVTAFRRHTRQTPFDYLRQCRVAFAAGQLVNTRRPLVEIALDAGFAHQSHFCRTFKAATAMTPTAYRLLMTGRPS